ncbi:hypothetical protein NVP2275O_398 [Vibrio phage 2.275.O._10N.286.54.E11]|nr:hypothetical protein NVP2275O_398 [Vibrio phage 2.275.O._10N.286.54.E11]
MTREEILKLISEERARQLDQPGTEFDHLKTKNDWTALTAYYLFETSTRKEKKVSFEEFRSSLMKAAGTILAALEHSYNHDEKAQKSDTTQEIMDKIRNERDDN